MSEACCEFHPSQGTPERRLPCPRCGTAGKPVARVTLGALLKPAARLRIPPGARFWFCTSPMCEAVYFGPGDVVFAKTDLTVRVGIKESEKPKPLCYCFGFTETAIVEDVKRHGRPTIPDTIKAQVKAGNCYCEVTNPQGSCCLGNISAVVRGLRAPQA
ncbi:MAG: copper chaperone Copz family protein [Candidatus Omnitrophica bacterium]|nr:copper chaperone Copz family protein [Candidatus Omnitrophota bacterium]